MKVIIFQLSNEFNCFAMQNKTLQFGKPNTLNEIPCIKANYTGVSNK